MMKGYNKHQNQNALRIILVVLYYNLQLFSYDYSYFEKFKLKLQDRLIYTFSNVCHHTVAQEGTLYKEILTSSVLVSTDVINLNKYGGLQLTTRLPAKNGPCVIA